MKQKSTALQALKPIEQQKLREWLIECLSNRWSPRSIPKLEALWLEYHDEYGAPK